MTSYQCRSCKTVLDGMGIVCTGCGTRIRNGREVRNLWLRALVALLAVITAVFTLIGLVLFLAFILLTLPVWVPLDWTLKHYGRRGFVVPEGNAFSLQFTPAAFRSSREKP